MRVPRYSQASIDALMTVHPTLQMLMIEALLDGYDHKVLEGARDEETQNRYFEQGWSTLRWPDSNHNRQPGERWVYAVDAAPYPVRWPNKEKRPETFAKDLARFYYFGGYLRGLARRMKIPIRQGLDWDGDFEVNDQKFDDTPHVELVRDKLTEDHKRYALIMLKDYWTRYSEATGHVIHIFDT